MVAVQLYYQYSPKPVFYEPYECYCCECRAIFTHEAECEEACEEECVDGAVGYEYEFVQGCGGCELEFIVPESEYGSCYVYDDQCFEAECVFRDCFQMFLNGIPPTCAFFSMSLFTSVIAEICALSPMVVPASMVVFAPTITFLPIFTLPVRYSSMRNSCASIVAL